MVQFYQRPSLQSDKQAMWALVWLPCWDTQRTPGPLTATGWVCVPGLLMGAFAEFDQAAATVFR